MSKINEAIDRMGKELDRQNIIRCNNYPTLLDLRSILLVGKEEVKECEHQWLGNKCMDCGIPKPKEETITIPRDVAERFFDGNGVWEIYKYIGKALGK